MGDDWQRILREPDSLLPAQLLEPTYPAARERELYYAVLITAIEDLCAKRDQDRRAAELWMELGDVGRISFFDACAVLDLTVSWVRKVARAYQARGGGGGAS